MEQFSEGQRLFEQMEAELRRYNEDLSRGRSQGGFESRFRCIRGPAAHWPDWR